MCIFGGEPHAVRSVAATNIFAASRRDGRQALIYSMNIAAAGAVAMILPLPVPAGSGEDAVQFVNLRGYPKLFQDLDQAFPAELDLMAQLSRSKDSPRPRRPKLTVHRVGDFEASFVPSQADFDRLDARFRLSDEVWRALPQYAEDGFAVFQLHGLARGGLASRMLGKIKKRTIHPMAFLFPRRDPQQLFFPTVHVHDGAVHEKEVFDHKLFAQCAQGQALSATDWTVNDVPLSRHVDGRRTAGLIDVDRPCYRLKLKGRLPNRDTLVRVLEPRPRWAGA